MCVPINFPLLYILASGSTGFLHGFSYQHHHKRGFKRAYLGIPTSIITSLNQTFHRYRYKVATIAIAILAKKVVTTAIATFQKIVARYFCAIDTSKK